MKSSSAFALSLLLMSFDVLLASPLISHVWDDFSLTPSGEEVGQAHHVVDPIHRWELIPDSNGRMHLIDMEAYQMPVEPLFNAEKDMKFILFTRSAAKGEQIGLDLKSIEASSFNRDHPTRITVHGWNGDETSYVNFKVIEGYLKLGDFNCIMVDWSRGSGTLDYIAARYRIVDVAKLTAKLIDFLFKKGFHHFKNLHIVGHSLGAHAAGLVGKLVTHGKVQAIYGLDAAAPLFYEDKPDERISASDGNYVEVMHTNGGTLGFGKPLGQVDIFPNFGRSQPGCGLDLFGTCAHLRASEYFAESITSDGFIAHRCESFVEIGKNRCTIETFDEFIIMGPEPANYGLEGIFFLKTNSKSPYAIGTQNISAQLINSNDLNDN